MLPEHANVKKKKGVPKPAHVIQPLTMLLDKTKCTACNIRVHGLIPLLILALKITLGYVHSK